MAGRWRDLTLWLVTFAGGLGFAALLVSLILASQRATAARDTATRWELHTYKVMLVAGQLEAALFDTQRSARGYYITGDRGMLVPYRRGLDKLPPLAAELRELTSDNPLQRPRVAQLAILLTAQRERMALALQHLEDGSLPVADAKVSSGAAEVTVALIRDTVGAIVGEEQRLLRDRTRQVALATAAADNARRDLSMVGLLLLAAALAAGFVAVRAALDARRIAAEADEDARALDVLERTVAVRTAEIAASNAALRDEIARKDIAEAQVRQMQKLESIGQLTGGIAHDFNNMLAIVIGSLDLALRRLEDPTGRVISYIDNAMDGAKRAASLTARLLAFSRQQPLAPEPINANTFVGNISELLRRTLGEGVQIETVLAGGLWRTYADAGELENAVLNLAVNARDAMDGAGKLTIETANTHLDDAYAREHVEVAAGQYIAICVTDTGGGMPPEVIAKAFDPFFTTKTVGKGTGLGLSQVFGFVKQSGGHVKIYSEPGEGTTVKIYLPRWRGADAPDRAVAPADELPHANEGETILVVEDEARVRLVTVDALRELGYTVVHAGDGAEALRLIGEQPRIDLLFTDIVMPGMNGRELADAASALLPELKILYTTGYTRNAVVHNGMLDAQVAFLPKPFTVDALAVKVRQVLDGGGINRPVA